MIRFTPIKFVDAVELNDIKFTHLVAKGMDRSYIIPRYKKGSHKIKDLTLSYRKGISEQAIERIFNVLVEVGILKENEIEKLKGCFWNDNFDALLPEDLL